jgi:CubicO group peptidase (beta-lactamase class C family)
VSLDNEFKLGPDYESGGAGIISSVKDLLLYGEGLYSGQVLRRRTMDLMRTNHLTPEMLTRDFTWSQHTGYGYGLGVATMMDCAKGSSLGSLGEFTWHGAAGSNLWVDPQEEIAIAYTQHVAYGDMPYYLPKLRNAAYYGLGY